MESLYDMTSECVQVYFICKPIQVQIEQIYIHICIYLFMLPITQTDMYVHK